MAYIPETSMNEMGLKIKIKKPKIKIKNPVKALAKVAQIGAAVATGGTSVAALKVGAVAAGKKILSKTGKNLTKKSGGGGEAVAPEAAIPATSDVVPQEAGTTSKKGGINKNYLIYGGIGLGAVLLIVLIAKK